MPDEDGAEKRRRRRPYLVSTLRDQLAVRRTIAGELISLANLLGRTCVGHRRQPGRSGELRRAVHWEAGTANPRVSGVVVSLSRGLAFLDASEVTFEQSKVRVRSTRISVVMPMRHMGDIGLARDVLDHQLVDIEGVQVVRAADVYLCKLPDGWELAGVDVGFRAYRAGSCASDEAALHPVAQIDWADLQTFVPRITGERTPKSTARRRRRAPSGVAFSLGLRPRICAGFPPKRSLRSFRTSAGGSRPRLPPWQPHPPPPRRSRELDQKHRDALLAELSESDRARLLALLDADDPE